MKNTLESLRQDVKSYGIDRLRDGIGEGDALDLHHHVYNEDYFIIGTDEAKQWLGDLVFDAIEEIRGYEQENYGEVTTDFSDPEQVANMIAYILGEEILAKSEILREKSDDQLTADDLLDIADEIEGA